MFGEWKALENAQEDLEEIKRNLTPSNSTVIGAVKGCRDSLVIYLEQQSNRLSSVEAKVDALQQMVKFDQAVFARILAEVKKNQRFLLSIKNGGSLGPGPGPCCHFWPGPGL